MAGQWRRDSDKRLKSTGRGLLKGGLKGVEERIRTGGIGQYDPNTESCSKCGVNFPPMKIVHDLCPVCRFPPKKDMEPPNFVEEDFEKPLKTAEFAPEVYKKQGVSVGKSKSSEDEKDELFHNIHKLENKPTFSEIKNQINKAIIKNPELRKSMSARKSWIDTFFDVNGLSNQDEKRRARVFLTCRVTELNRK